MTQNAVHRWLREKRLHRLMATAASDWGGQLQRAAISALVQRQAAVRAQRHVGFLT
jgi:hypothetical protein